jgi:hypothetical protein
MIRSAPVCTRSCRRRRQHAGPQTTHCWKTLCSTQKLKSCKENLDQYSCCCHNRYPPRHTGPQQPRQQHSCRVCPATGETSTETPLKVGNEKSAVVFFLLRSQQIFFKKKISRPPLHAFKRATIGEEKPVDDVGGAS